MIIDDGEYDLRESASVEASQFFLEAPGDGVGALAKGAATPRREYDVGAFFPLHVHHIQ